MKGKATSVAKNILKRVDFVKDISYNKNDLIRFSTENITNKYAPSFKKKAQKEMQKKSSGLSLQGSEGAFCENCFLARNLPTCFACKAEIAGTGDNTFDNCQICTC